MTLRKLLAYGILRSLLLFVRGVIGWLWLSLYPWGRLLLAALLLTGCATRNRPYLFVRNGLPDTLWVSARDSTEVRTLAIVLPQDSICVRIPFVGKVTIIGETRTGRSEKVIDAEDPWVFLLTTGNTSRLRPREALCGGPTIQTFTAP